MGQVVLKVENHFFLDYRVIPPVWPICQDACLVEGMDVDPLPLLHWLPQNRFKTNKQFFLGKRVVQSHKQAISHFCSPTGPRVSKSKEYTQTGGKGGSWDPHPSTHSVKSSVLLQKPVSFS